MSKSNPNNPDYYLKVVKRMPEVAAYMLSLIFRMSVDFRARALFETLMNLNSIASTGGTMESRLNDLDRILKMDMEQWPSTKLRGSEDYDEPDLLIIVVPKYLRSITNDNMYWTLTMDGKTRNCVFSMKEYVFSLKYKLEDRKKLAHFINVNEGRRKDNVLAPLIEEPTE